MTKLPRFNPPRTLGRFGTDVPTTFGDQAEATHTYHTYVHHDEMKGHHPSTAEGHQHALKSIQSELHEIGHGHLASKIHSHKHVGEDPKYKMHKYQVTLKAHPKHIKALKDWDKENAG